MRCELCRLGRRRGFGNGEREVEEAEDGPGSVSAGWLA